MLFFYACLFVLVSQAICSQFLSVNQIVQIFQNVHLSSRFLDVSRAYTSANVHMLRKPFLKAKCKLLFMSFS